MRAVVVISVVTLVAVSVEEVMPVDETVAAITLAYEVPSR